MNKFFNFLGLAKRSGNLIEGYSKCDEQRNRRSFYLVILSDDASNSTKKKFRNSCEYYGVPYYEYATKEELGRHIGKEMRASVAVTNAGLAGSLIKLLDSSNLGGSIDG